MTRWSDDEMLAPSVITIRSSQAMYQLRIALLPLLVALCAIAPTASAATPAPPQPIGLPLPGNPTLGDLLSTSGESGDVSGALPAAGACDSASQRSISLPADDGPHNDVQYEYWWWFGHAITNDGRRIGFMVIFYSKPWAHIQEAQYAITDLSTGAFHQAVEPLIIGRPKSATDQVVLRGADAVARGSGGRDTLRLAVGGYRLRLSLQATKSPIAHYGDGNVTPYCQDVYTYSRPRMQLAGTLRRGGEAVRLRGTGTFEHLWGFAPVAPIPSWVHTNIQLRDGRDILLFVVHFPQDGGIASLETGWISSARGKAITLHRGDFTTNPVRYWRRDASCSYPIEWEIAVKGLNLNLRAPLETTELRTANSPLSLALWPEFPAVWDGPMVVSGDASGVGWNDLGHPCYI